MQLMPKRVMHFVKFLDSSCEKKWGHFHQQHAFQTPNDLYQVALTTLEAADMTRASSAAANMFLTPNRLVTSVDRGKTQHLNDWNLGKEIELGWPWPKLPGIDGSSCPRTRLIAVTHRFSHYWCTNYCGSVDKGVGKLASRTRLCGGALDKEDVQLGA